MGGPPSVERAFPAIVTSFNFVGSPVATDTLTDPLTDESTFDKVTPVQLAHPATDAEMVEDALTFAQEAAKSREQMEIRLQEAKLVEELK